MDAWDSKWVAHGPVTPETETEFKALFELFLGRKVRVNAGGYLLEEGSLKVREPRVKASEFYEGRLTGSSGNAVR